MKRTEFRGDSNREQTRELLRLFADHRRQRDGRYGELTLDPAFGPYKPDAAIRFNRRAIWLEHTIAVPYDKNPLADTVIHELEALAFAGLSLPPERACKVDVPPEFLERKHRREAAGRLRAWLVGNIGTIPIGHTEAKLGRADIRVRVDRATNSSITIWPWVYGHAMLAEAREQVRKKIDRYRAVMRSGQPVDLLVEHYVASVDSQHIDDAVRQLAPLLFRQLWVAETSDDPPEFRRLVRPRKRKLRS